MFNKQYIHHLWWIIYVLNTYAINKQSALDVLQIISHPETGKS